MDSFQGHLMNDVSRNLKRLLSSNKKKVAFLFGAGTSMNLGSELKEYNIPGITRLTEIVEDSLEEKYKETIESIRDNLGSEYNLESLLSNINIRKSVIGKGTIDNLDIQGLEAMENIVIHILKGEIMGHLEIYNKELVQKLPHNDFVKWVKNNNRAYGAEIFTTNYDLLIEMALENQKVRFIDGFSGSYKAFFDNYLVDNFDNNIETTKLWKIHGSIGWSDSYNGIIRDSKGDDLIILPSIIKYQNSRKQPYISFLDRLSNFLKRDDCVLICNGYSFNDQHINEVILKSLRNNSNSLVIGLYYDKLEGIYQLNGTDYLSKLAIENNRLWVLGGNSAIINSVYGKYYLKSSTPGNYELNLDIFEQIINMEKDDDIIYGLLDIIDSVKLFKFLASFGWDEKYE